MAASKPTSHKSYWCNREGSNLWPRDYQSRALPAELQLHDENIWQGQEDSNLPTFGFGDRCSTN